MAYVHAKRRPAPAQRVGLTSGYTIRLYNLSTPRKPCRRASLYLVYLWQITIDEHISWIV